MRAQRRYGSHIGTIDTTSSTPSPTFRQRHCRSVRNTRANSSPAKHHSDSDAIAAKLPNFAINLHLPRGQRTPAATELARHLRIGFARLRAAA